MSDPSKSREMKERWRDPEYRARMATTLHKATESRRDSKYIEGGLRRRKRDSTRVATAISAAPEVPQRLTAAPIVTTTRE